MDHLTPLILFCLLACAFGNPLLQEPEKVSEELALNNKVSGRIVGGRPASYGTFPYQVSLQRDGQHFCGGSILNSKWILTAGHCFIRPSTTGIVAVVGISNLNEEGERYRLQTVIVHPNFNAYRLFADIALLQVAGRIKFSSYVNPIALPYYDITRTNQPVIVSGWGRTLNGKGIPTQLQYLNSRIYDQKRCQEFSLMVSNRNICTFTKRGEGLCNGDSGGPVVANGVQVGIVSWGAPCARGAPDVHTKVFSYVNWINNYVNA